METRRFETVFDYSKEGVDVGVQCAWSHTARLDPKATSKSCITKGLDTRMPAIKARLKSRACGRRDVECLPVERD